MRLDDLVQPRTSSGVMAALPDELYWARVEARLLANAKRSGDCLLWRGQRTKAGYGHISIRRRKENVHRVAYTIWVGDVAEGLEVDHLCRVRHCIEPTHLEAVTHLENLRRMRAATTHCRRGHEYPAGGGRCRTCRRASNRASKRSRRAARKEQGL